MDTGDVHNRVLAACAESIDKSMSKVEVAEAKYAKVYRKVYKPKSIFMDMMTGGKEAGPGHPAFEELASAVADLTHEWGAFRMMAAAVGMSWKEALPQVMPQLYSEHTAQADGLRDDSVFAYAVVTSDDMMMQCFRWRLESGYC